MNLLALAIKNLKHNRFRSWATVLSVAVSVLAFVLLRTVISAWITAAEYAPKDRLVTRHRASFVMPLPRHYVDTVRRVPGVRTATFATWFGGRDPKLDSDTFTTWAVDRGYLNVWDEFELSTEGRRAWDEDLTGAIVGEVLAEKHGWKVGDRVSLESGIFPADRDRPWTFAISAVYKARSSSVDKSSFLFHWDYLNESLPGPRRDQVGWIATRTLPGARAADVGAAIDRFFEDGEVQTRTEDEKSFQASVLAASSAVLNAVGAVSLILLLIMALLIGNTITMSVSERTKEFGILRAVGFQPGQLALVVLAESSLLAGAGGLLGLALSYPLIQRGIGAFIEANMGSLLPHFAIHPTVALGAIAAVITLSQLVAAGPSYHVFRLRIVDALRKEA
jgi:putative ABC transport system permease protein